MYVEQLLLSTLDALFIGCCLLLFQKSWLVINWNHIIICIESGILKIYFEVAVNDRGGKTEYEKSTVFKGILECKIGLCAKRNSLCAFINMLSCTL